MNGENLRDLSVRSVEYRDIETLRNWRNSDHVRSQMVNQKIISKADQLVWFRKIVETAQEHFIYSFQSLDIGHLHLSPIVGTNVAEVGIMCGREQYLGHPVNIYAMVWLYDYLFDQKGLSQARAQVLAKNSRALKMNLFFGFLVDDDSDGGLLTLSLNKNNYIENRGRIIRNKA